MNTEHIRLASMKKNHKEGMARNSKSMGYYQEHQYKYVGRPKRDEGREWERQNLVRNCLFI